MYMTSQTTDVQQATVDWAGEEGVEEGAIFRKQSLWLTRLMSIIYVSDPLFILF